MKTKYIILIILLGFMPGMGIGLWLAQDFKSDSDILGFGPTTKTNQRYRSTRRHNRVNSSNRIIKREPICEDLSELPPLERMETLIDLIGSMNSEQLRAFAEGGKGWTGRNWQMIDHVLFTQWSKLDPEGAMTFIAEHEDPGQRSYRGAVPLVIKQWANSDPASVIDSIFFADYLSHTNKLIHHGELCDALAESNPQYLPSVLSRVDDSSKMLFLLRNHKKLLDRNPEMMLDVWSTLAPRSRALTAPKLAEYWMTRDRVLAEAWVENLPAELKKKVRDGLREE